ncbi:MAG: phosphohydrolase [Steroidobacteraceae bacterium]
MSLMLTASGRTFDPRAMAADGTTGSVTIEDIAHSLSHICRFGGHCERAYSVAEHSLYVADILKSRGMPAAGQLAGLLHDGHEAYCGDVPTPIKRALGEPWREFESGVEKAVHAALGVSNLMDTWQASVHDADLSALVTEIRVLFLAPADAEARIRALGLQHVEPHSVVPGAAAPSVGLAQRFLERYHTLRQEL